MHNRIRTVRNVSKGCVKLGLITWEVGRQAENRKVCRKNLIDFDREYRNWKKQRCEEQM